MRILWLDHAGRVGRHDEWLHVKFAETLAKHVDFLMLYAPYMHEKVPQLTPKHYSPAILLGNLVNEYNIDVVVMDTKSSMFGNYFPKSIYPERSEGSCWLPQDFKDCKVFKLAIEEDFQYETDDKWYSDLGIKLILQKHYVFTLYNQFFVLQQKFKLPVEFFPFSVDTNVFKPVYKTRDRRIAFAGTVNTGNLTSGGSVYKPRETAIGVLRKNPQYFAPDSVISRGQMIVGNNYVDYLQKYLGYISCGSIYNLSPAKMTEIMASGGILITNETLGLNKLFDEGSYLTYNDKADDLIGKVEKIYHDVKFADDMVAKSLDCINRRHSHDIRCKEFIEIVNKYR